MKFLITSFLVIVSFILSAQSSKVNQYIFDQRNQLRWLNQYKEFLSIPNVLGDSVNMVRNANWIKDLLVKYGIKSQLLQSGKAGSAPVVYGEVITPGATATIAFYAHYDGQPVNPKQWAEGLAPFMPTLLTDRLDKGGKIISFPGEKEIINPQWRLYGRGSSDDKAGVFAIITAYESLIAAGLKPTTNIKFFFEGEEEIGSAHLGEIFEQHKDKLSADLWVIADGPRHVSGKKMVLFGVRGDVNMDLTVYGPKRPLHSGNYGNWAPNPAMLLVQLLASMKDDNGNVLVKGFYDDVTPLTEAEKQAIAKVPGIEETLKKELGIARPDGAGKSFLELLLLPTLNINGIQSANTGKLAANIIPVKAAATLDLRLVLGNDLQRQVQKLRDHITARGYHIIDHEPTDEERMQYARLIKITTGSGYNAQRTPMNLPAAQEVIKAIQSTVDYPVVVVPSAGGSLPLFLFEKQLGAKVITVPLVNYDNNQHAENENVKLQFLWEGIETIAAIMMMR